MVSVSSFVNFLSYSIPFLELMPHWTSPSFNLGKSFFAELLTIRQILHLHRNYRRMAYSCSYVFLDHNFAKPNNVAKHFHLYYNHFLNLRF